MNYMTLQYYACCDLEIWYNTLGFNILLRYMYSSSTKVCHILGKLYDGIRISIVKKMSKYTTRCFLSLMLGLAIVPSQEFVRAELGTTGNEESFKLETPQKVVVRKCCKENEILVEVDVGRRICRLRSDYLAGMVFIIVLEYLC